MTDPNDPSTAAAPPSSDAASAPARSGFTLRGRRWVYGATLAAAGVLAGSGVTYAVVNVAPDAQTQTFQTDGGPRGAGARGGTDGQGAPPDGTAPGGTAPDGTASAGA